MTQSLTDTVGDARPDNRATAALPASAGVYDIPEIQRRYASSVENDGLEAHLMLYGINCSGCAVAIERKLNQVAGVREAEVNFSNHRARVRWDPARTTLGDLLHSVHSIGYEARPYDPNAEEAMLTRERRAHLRRLAVAGVLGMQVMMITIALYSGAWSGMATHFEQLFRWVSLALTAGVMAYPALPFFRGALRSIRTLTLGMDVPVALGLGIAFVSSAVSTVRGAGEVYFESVVMFVFLLLLARFLQFEARQRTAAMRESMTNATPATADRVSNGDGSLRRVAVSELEVGDRIRVLPGETIPADGRIVSGVGSVSEAVITGESKSLPRVPGDRVLGGSINESHALDIEVAARADDSQLSRLLNLASRVSQQKPRLAQLADRIAGWFIAAVLVFAAAVALFWWNHDPARWIPVTIAMLVVTCPCALSLATPTAITAAIGRLTRRGMLLTNVEAIENLSRARDFVFDKTGTLTRGLYEVNSVSTYGSLSEYDAVRAAAALERYSEHAIARAFASRSAGQVLPAVSEPKVYPGHGVSGIVENRRLWLGSARFVEGRCQKMAGSNLETTSTRVFLADDSQVLARFLLDDRLRPHARQLIGNLQKRGYGVTMLSGDHEGPVQEVARALGIQHWRAGVSPEAKAEWVKSAEADGHHVIMVGDGLNDTPVSACATVSIAMGEGTDATQARADAILVSSDLEDLEDAVEFVHRVRAVIRQNFRWALAYNLIALPAAAAGLIAPWFAALGMSLSSLVVVGNSLRLVRDRQPARSERAPVAGERLVPSP